MNCKEGATIPERAANASPPYNVMPALGGGAATPVRVGRPVLWATWTDEHAVVLGRGSAMDCAVFT